MPQIHFANAKHATRIEIENAYKNVGELVAKRLSKSMDDDGFLFCNMIQWLRTSFNLRNEIQVF